MLWNKLGFDGREETIRGFILFFRMQESLGVSEVTIGTRSLDRGQPIRQVSFELRTYLSILTFLDVFL